MVQPIYFVNTTSPTLGLLNGTLCLSHLAIFARLLVVFPMWLSCGVCCRWLVDRHRWKLSKLILETSPDDLSTMRKEWQDQYFSGRWHAQENDSFRISSSHFNKYQISNLIDKKNKPPKPLHNPGCSKPVSGCCDWLFSARNTILFASQCKYLDLVTNQKTRQVFSGSRCEGSNFKKIRRQNPEKKHLPKITLF